MKFSCEKALLSGAVAVTSRAVAAKSSIPAMEGILIEAGESLRLTGYNLETGIQATVPAEIKEKRNYKLPVLQQSLILQWRCDQRLLQLLFVRRESAECSDNEELIC